MPGVEDWRLAALGSRFFEAMNSVFLDLPAVISERPKGPKNGTRCTRDRQCWPFDVDLAALALGDEAVRAGIVPRLRGNFFWFLISPLRSMP